MKEIGNRIREIRKQKGLSQEDLANAANINLRTVQRIEKDQSEPRGKTLQLICEALHVEPEGLLTHGKHPDRKFLFFFHLSAISFLVLPLGNIFLPLILWLTKKDRILGLKETGANLLNFQIAWTVLSFIAITAFAFFKIMHYPYAEVFFYNWRSLYLINVVLPVISALRVRKEKHGKLYPAPLRLVK